ncbi:MAG: hypothetical protein IJR17_04415 [Clostridia bacterium]|nr:hypothetical protein [Clostridia bacterium]
METQTQTEKPDQTVELLLQQRRNLEQNMSDKYQNMFKMIVAVIALIGTMFAADKWLSDDSTISFWNTPLFRFIIIQFIVITGITITAFLINTNINRDYIIAIDEFLKDNYGIKVLFNNGELSRKHTTGFREAFPLATFILGTSILLLMLVTFIHFMCNDWNYYKKHFYLLVILAFQGLGMSVVLIKNFVRKTKRGKSSLTNDVLNYFSRE